MDKCKYIPSNSNKLFTEKFAKSEVLFKLFKYNHTYFYIKFYNYKYTLIAPSLILGLLLYFLLPPIFQLVVASS